MKPSVSVTDRALAAARGLYDRSQPAEALAICDYILSVDPEDARVLHLSAAAQAATGRVDAALLGLAALRRSSRGFDPTLPGPTQIGCSGVAAYNEALAAEDPEQAASIADALAELFPDSVPMLRHALHANVVLERDDRVASYAERLLACEPGSLDGLSGMIDHCRRISDYTAETEYRVRLARALTDSDLASGVKLENLFLAVSGLLCSELDDRAVSLVSELRSYAADLPADDEMRGLSTYIRGPSGRSIYSRSCRRRRRRRRGRISHSPTPTAGR